MRGGGERELGAEVKDEEAVEELMRGVGGERGGGWLGGGGVEEVISRWMRIGSVGGKRRRGVG